MKFFSIISSISMFLYIKDKRYIMVLHETDISFPGLTRCTKLYTRCTFSILIERESGRRS